jgi:GNAT superfamily N-acetyltransferase
MPLNYRPARVSDLEPAMAMIIEAIDVLERQHGFEGLVVDGDLSNPFAAFSLKDDPSGLWVAEESAVLQGYGFSWTSGPLWFLADLFVRPGQQTSGIGRALIERTMKQADAHDASIRALITFAYNRVSLGLYMRLGLFPIVPLIELTGPLPKATASLAVMPIDADGKDAPLLEELDQSVLGLSRAKHHHYSAQRSDLNGYILKTTENKPMGYLYISDAGRIGPVAVISAELMAQAVATGFAIAAKLNCPAVSAIIPGPCGSALSLALSSGLRIRRPMVLLASRAFGDWDRYAPRDPGFM